MFCSINILGLTAGVPSTRRNVIMTYSQIERILSIANHSVEYSIKRKYILMCKHKFVMKTIINIKSTLTEINVNVAYYISYGKFTLLKCSKYKHYFKIELWINFNK